MEDVEKSGTHRHVTKLKKITTTHLCFSGIKGCSAFFIAPYVDFIAQQYSMSNAIMRETIDDIFSISSFSQTKYG